jgi:hypothetical protein
MLLWSFLLSITLYFLTWISCILYLCNFFGALEKLYWALQNIRKLGRLSLKTYIWRLCCQNLSCLLPKSSTGQYDMRLTTPFLYLHLKLNVAYFTLSSSIYVFASYKTSVLWFVSFEYQCHRMYIIERFSRIENNNVIGYTLFAS